jgi:hypothetical protein
MIKGLKVPLEDEVRRQAALEVLGLGETLFDAVIDAAADRPATDEGSGEVFPAEDLRAAAVEFFRALRVLLGIEGEAG